MYCDDISLDYAFAQSVLFKVYGSTVQETGHKTKGIHDIKYSIYLTVQKKLSFDSF